MNKTYALPANSTILMRDLSTAGFAVDDVTSDGVSSTSVSIAGSLTTEEETELDSIVESHSVVWRKSTPSAQQFRIYEYVVHTEEFNPAEPPFDINFKIDLVARLHPNHTMVQGEIQKVEYFVSANIEPDGSVSYSTPVLEETFSYVRDAAGFALYRTQEISWYLRDGTLSSDKKTMMKYYEPADRLAEGIRRRGNILRTLEATIAGILIQIIPGEIQARLQVGRDFIAAHKDALELFRDTSDQMVYYDIVAATDAWLDTDLGGGVTPRAIILAEVNIWGL